MPSSIRVVCNNATVRSAVSQWIDRSRVLPGIELTFRIRVGEPMLPQDDRTVFRQPAVEIRSGPPEGGVSISWVVGPAVATLPADLHEAHVVLSTFAVTRLDLCIQTFLKSVLLFLVRRAGWHHVHGATAMDPKGRGWLISGDARDGKSTTAALLASRKWPVGTDDTAFIVDGSDKVSVKAYHCPIALRRGGYTLLGLQVGKYLERRQKMVCWPEELGAEWLPSVEPDILLFTKVGDQVSKAEPIRAREALAELVHWSAWVVLEPELAQEHLDLLAKLARQAKGYKVTLGRDLFDEPNRLTELIP